MGSVCLPAICTAEEVQGFASGSGRVGVRSWVGVRAKVRVLETRPGRLVLGLWRREVLRRGMWAKREELSGIV